MEKKRAKIESRRRRKRKRRTRNYVCVYFRVDVKEGKGK